MIRYDLTILAFLAVEFLDELVFGTREAAWPLIRTDLGLTYVQIGLLLTVPNVMSHLLEPGFGILGDIWNRRALILGGGLFLTMSVALIAASPGFLILLVAFCVGYPASGAFVSLAQATLMDYAPARRDQNMARWGFAGYLGSLLGALALAGWARAGAGWRGLFAVLSGTSLVVLVAVWRPVVQVTRQPSRPLQRADIVQGIGAALASLRNRSVIRWLVLLEMSDLTQDILYGFLALYFVDVADVSEATAAVGVAVWMAAGFAGSLLLIPLLERASGLTYLRYSALFQIGFFAAFLLAGPLPVKLAMAALMGLSSAGWYAVLKARLYSEVPDRSGTVMTLGSISGLAGGLIPLGIGLAASSWGLGPTMWLLMAGPVAITAGLPLRHGKAKDGLNLRPH